ncbi:MAG: ACT domain-containing protein [Verrucomicrobiia bacterium]
MNENNYSVRLLAIFAENRIGELARVSGILAANQINIRWVTIASSNGYGVVKLLVNKPQDSFDLLKRESIPVTMIEVVAVEVEDKPGGLYKIARCLADNKINVHNASGYVAKNSAILLIEVNDKEAARRHLVENGFKVLNEQEALAV